ncbi:MAG: transferase [Prevotella sp.]|nr:transferase [Prevotella sp.]
MTSQEENIYVLGVGASTPVFCEIASACGYDIIGLYHYNGERTGDIINGIKVLGSFDDLFNRDIKGQNFMLSMGDPQIRYELFKKIKLAGGLIPTIIHPMSIISPNSEVSSDGVVIGPMVIVQANAQISPNVVIRDMALICHDAKINSHVFIGPKSLVGAGCNIDSYAFIGQASTLISHKAEKIGKCSVIGAGAVVTKSVEDYHIVAGTAARTIRVIENTTEDGYR